MVSYNFTYKDVLKRYERILNKPSKFEIRLLACILLVITIVNITSFCFADTEGDVIPGTIIAGLDAAYNRNYFISSSSGNVTYYPVKEGYTYSITQIQTSYGRVCVYSSDIPANNGPYDIIYTFQGGTDDGFTFNYLSNTDGYIVLNGITTGSFEIVERKIEGQVSAVNDLVENVGISQIWEIFDNGIGFVGFVVLFAFGIFLIVVAVKKVSKGKSDF